MDNFSKAKQFNHIQISLHNISQIQNYPFFLTFHQVNYHQYYQNIPKLYNLLNSILDFYYN